MLPARCHLYSVGALTPMILAARSVCRLFGPGRDLRLNRYEEGTGPTAPLSLANPIGRALTSARLVIYLGPDPCFKAAKGAGRFFWIWIFL